MAYEPGDGVAQTLSTRSRTPGDLRDHVAAALALLRAPTTLTDRLPYPMLAEELMYGTTAARRLMVGMSSLEAAGVDVAAAGERLQRDRRFRAVACDAAKMRRTAAGARNVHATAPRCSTADPPVALASASYGLALKSG